MAAISAIIAGIGLGISAAGTVAGVQASQKQAKAQDRALSAQQDAENSRKKAMDLDASRRRREIIRNAQVARSTALAAATNQGAAAGSGLQGGYGSISGQSGVNTQGVNQQQEIGGDIFGANSNVNSAYRDAAAAGSDANFASGVSSLGGMFVKNAGTIARIGGYN